MPNSEYLCHIELNSDFSETEKRRIDKNFKRLFPKPPFRFLGRDGDKFHFEASPFPIYHANKTYAQKILEGIRHGLAQDKNLVIK